MFRRVVAALSLLLLIACAKDAAAPAEPVGAVADNPGIALGFQAASGLNPGVSGQPAPVRVRIFELRNAAAFTRADYFSLVERAQATLGADLIDQDEVLLQPGQQLNIERPLNPATRHVGLVVGYREIDQAQWRTVLDIAPRQPGHYQISLDARAVRTAVATPNRPAQ